jgi:hypothetical protein
MTFEPTPTDEAAGEGYKAFVDSGEAVGTQE